MRDRNILVADSNEELRAALAMQLSRVEEFNLLEVCTSASNCVNLIESEHVDLLLIDFDVSTHNSIETVRKLRNMEFIAPIIFLSEECSDTAILLGLESGANDVISKSTSIAVLIAKINAHFRQLNYTNEVKYVLGRFIFYPVLKKLTDEEGKRILLTEKETAILLYMIKAGRVVTREELLKKVWRYDDTSESHTVETHICRLRKKIENDPKNPILLKSKGGGYMLEL